jgi:cell division protein ZapA
MAQVTVRINGFAYTIGCEDGQEEHLRAMSAAVERRVESVKALAGGQAGEAKLLVLAALLMADELHDATAALAAAPAGAAAPARGPVIRPDAALARTLARLADRAEEIAASLEHP